MDQTNEMNNLDGSEIAIIGLSGRFPGAPNIETFWQNLRSGVESVSFFSDQELLEAGVDLQLIQNPRYVKAASLLDGVAMFDASFFGINHREAEMTDPQHRLLLECAWEALENAGYDPYRYTGSIGVYAGASVNPHWMIALFSAHAQGSSAQSIGLLETFCYSRDYLATRISYKLNLRGPSLNVQSACSTSLVAVHLACQSILNGECDIALAGGVAAVGPMSKVGYLYQDGDITSPDGHCRAFDAHAGGTVFGHGLGLVVLKRLDEAMQDGDNVLAIIKGSAINNDGTLKVGFTAPSIDGQAQVIGEALSIAGVNPETITYVEMHGTATAMGDPIEVAALTNAFRRHTNAKGFCAIGSVKTNVGHLTSAAGVTGLIKTVLMLKNKLILPSLHYKNPNPQIDFENSPFFVNTGLTEWKTQNMPRRAGVSSFGMGGTNAHIVLEEAIEIESSTSPRPYQLLLLAAKTPTALESMTANLAEHFKKFPHLNLADVAYTLQVGRGLFEHRRMIVCCDLADAVQAIEEQRAERVLTSTSKPDHRAVTFMFPGQGAQYVNMTLGLYESEPTFREQVDRCASLLKPYCQFDIRQILHPNQQQKDVSAEDLLNQTQMTQLALFTVEYALAQLWIEWGIHPQAMIGHSLGEYVAACLAGVMSLEDALKLVNLRGQLMQALPPGEMLAVPLSEQEISPLLGLHISLAAVNGPKLCVVSGIPAEVEKLERQLNTRGLMCRRLHTSHAFHSSTMEAIVKPFTDQVKKIKLNPPQIPYISNLTGEWIKDAEATSAEYWGQHLRHTVRFADGINHLLKQTDVSVMLEIGPGQTLSTLARQCLAPKSNTVLLSSLRHPQDQRPDVAVLLDTLGRLWLAGVSVDWTRFYKHEQRQRLPLPTYPFERQRYWLDTADASLQVRAQFSSARDESLNLGGKLDSPLTLYPRSGIPQAYIAPRNEFEEALVTIWQELLGVQEIGVHDNFFELGGHSLLAIRLLSRIHDMFPIVELPLRCIFEMPTVAKLSELLEQTLITKIQSLSDEEAQKML